MSEAPDEESMLLGKCLLCGFCRQIMYDPCITPCRCSYCRECIRLCLNNSHLCPGPKNECRSRKIQYQDDILPDNIAISRMEGLISRCPNSTTDVGSTPLNIREHLRVCEYCRAVLNPVVSVNAGEDGPWYDSIKNGINHLANEFCLVKRSVVERPKGQGSHARIIRRKMIMQVGITILVAIILCLLIIIYHNYHYHKVNTKHETSILEGQLKDYKIADMERLKINELNELKRLTKEKLEGKDKEINAIKEEFERSRKLSEAAQQRMKERLRALGRESKEKLEKKEKEIKTIKEEFERSRMLSEATQRTMSERLRTLDREFRARVTELEKLVAYKEAALRQLQQDVAVAKAKELKMSKHGGWLQYSGTIISTSVVLAIAFV